MSTEQPSTRTPAAAGNVPGLRPAWLALRQEEILDPQLPIIDAHHHLWEHPGAPYLAGEMVEDLRSGHNVVATVYVESDTGFRTFGPEHLRPVGETEFAVAEAEDAARLWDVGSLCAAIVGPVSLALGAAVRPVLEAHLEAGRGRFRGVRDLKTHWDGDPVVHRVDSRPGLLGSPEAAEAAAVLVEMGLSLDAFCYHTQLADVLSLARAFPDLRIVVNHVGTPVRIGRYGGRCEEVFSQWRSGMEALRGQENVSLKFGGLGMRFGGFGFDRLDIPPSSEDLARAWRPYFEVSVDAFGPCRCMFESNFPVDKTSFSYAVLWNAFKRLSRDFTADERAHLLSRTAGHFYAIPAG